MAPSWIITALQPARTAPPLPPAEVPRAFRRCRYRAFLSVYVGYAFYYFLRKNIAPALPGLMAGLRLSKGQLGAVMSGFSGMYAVAKLVNGPLCDRSSPGRLMALGLAGATLCNLGFGLGNGLLWLGLAWIANGYFQSMGSPVGPKTMANWFSSSERGRYYSLWNTCHNAGASGAIALGGLIVQAWGWRAAFLVPTAIGVAGVVAIATTMLDRPESVGLPSIQEYHGDPASTLGRRQGEETARQLLERYVVKNGRLWLAALACFCIYAVRNGLADWGVTYLNETHPGSLGSASLATSCLELFGIPGTLAAGWLSDRCSRGRSSMIAAVYALAATAAVLLIYYAPFSGRAWHAAAFGLAGFFVYGAQMVCTGLVPLELVPRQAAASAVGLTGAMSYLGAVATSALSGWIADRRGWRATFSFWGSCGVMTFAFLLPLARRRQP